MRDPGLELLGHLLEASHEQPAGDVAAGGQARDAVSQRHPLTLSRRTPRRRPLARRRRSSHAAAVVMVVT
jgi:hypothetical protein